MNILLLDGETCETYRDQNGKLDTTNGQVYDLGGGVLNTNDGSLTKTFSLVNEDVFFGMPLSMKEAYFADKIPQYVEGLKNGQYQRVNTWQMWGIVHNICENEKIDAIAGHNVWFDVKTLNTMIRYQTKSKKRFFLPYNIPIIDTMRMAQKTIATTDDYVNFCKFNNYLTNHDIPRPRLTAEILWRYLTQDNTFEESHTGLKDVEIEAQIFMECLKRGYPFPEMMKVSAS